MTHDSRHQLLEYVAEIPCGTVKIKFPEAERWQSVIRATESISCENDLFADLPAVLSSLRELFHDLFLRTLRVETSGTTRAMRMEDRLDLLPRIERFHRLCLQQVEEMEKRLDEYHTVQAQRNTRH